MCRSIDSELYLISRYSGYGIAMGIVNGNGDIIHFERGEESHSASVRKRQMWKHRFLAW